MRKIFVPNFVFAVLSIFLFSCDKTTSTDSIPTSLKISIDKASVIADGIEKATVTVKDQSNNDVTASCAIYVNKNYNISGSKISFESTEQGSYKVYATKYGVTSDTAIITATNPGVAKYSSKVLAEVFTANWAGWCPRTSYKLDNFVTAIPNLCVMQIHNNDVFYDKYTDSLMRSRYSVTAVPNILLNRKYFFQENGDINSLSDSTEFRNFLQRRAVLGLALNTSIAGNTLTVTAKTGFDATITDSLKLMVVVVENGLIAPQKNYYHQNANYPATPYFNAGDTINNFVHNFVFRKSPTTVLGVTIPSDKQIKNGEYAATYTINTTGYNTANLKVIAFVTYADGQPKVGLLNAQWVNAGQNKAYD